MTPEQIATIVGAFGLGTILRELARWFMRRRDRAATDDRDWRKQLHTDLLHTQQALGASERRAADLQAELAGYKARLESLSAQLARVDRLQTENLDLRNKVQRLVLSNAVLRGLLDAAGIPYPPTAVVDFDAL